MPVPQQQEGLGCGKISATEQLRQICLSPKHPTGINHGEGG